MAIDYATLEAHFAAAGLKYTLRDGYIHTTFATDIYRNREGSATIYLIARLEEDGEYFKLIAPSLYQIAHDSPYGQDVFRVLLGICWRTKLIKFEYDELDGEIRAVVEFPLEDSSLSQKQLVRCINGLVQIMDEYHPAIHTALRGGHTSLDETEQFSDIMRHTEQLYRTAGVQRPQRPVKPSDLLLEE